MNKKLLGQMLKDQRKKKKMRQYEVSEKTGLSRNYISDIENGRYMPSVDTLYKLAACLELDLNAPIKTEIQYNNPVQEASEL